MSEVKSTPDNQYMVSTEDDIIQQALMIIEKRLRVTEGLYNSPDLIGWHFNLKIGSLEHEELHVMFLNPQLQMIESSMMFRGSVSCCYVIVREIFKKALALNATGIVIAHNHPTGDLSASNNDLTLTKEIMNVCDLLDIELVDHVIVSHGQHMSMREKGLI